MFAHTALQIGKPAWFAATVLGRRFHPITGTILISKHIFTSESRHHGISPPSIQLQISREKHSIAKKIAMKPLHEQATFTIPNILTMSRIACSPAIGYFIWNGMLNQALACFLYAAVTDLLDGLIARRFNQYTDLGAILDPIADKLLLTTCFIAMYNTNMMPLWLIKGCIVRDLILLIGGASIRYYGFDKPPTFKQYVDFNRYPSLGFEPTLISKCNTALQCSAILVNLSTNHLVGQHWYDWSLFGLYATISFTTVASMVQYILRFQRSPFMSNFKRPKGWDSKLK